MTEDEIREVVLGVLGEIAPEAELDALEPDVDFQDQLDVDSMDFLNFVIGMHGRLDVEIPEADYGALNTLDKCVCYLKSKIDSKTRP